MPTLRSNTDRWRILTSPARGSCKLVPYFRVSADLECASLPPKRQQQRPLCVLQLAYWFAAILRRPADPTRRTGSSVHLSDACHVIGGWRRCYSPDYLFLFPGFPGKVPMPSLIGGLPGGCGSYPLPTPLLPRLDPDEANDGIAFSVKIAGATYAAVLRNFRLEELSSFMSVTLILTA